MKNVLRSFLFGLAGSISVGLIMPSLLYALILGLLNTLSPKFLDKEIVFYFIFYSFILFTILSAILGAIGGIIYARKYKK